MCGSSFNKVSYNACYLSSPLSEKCEKVLIFNAYSIIFDNILAILLLLSIVIIIALDILIDTRLYRRFFDSVSFMNYFDRSKHLEDDWMAQRDFIKLDSESEKCWWV